MYVNKALDILKKFPAPTLDARTLEILKETLEDEKKGVSRLAAGLAAEDRAEFLELFAEETDQIDKALADIASAQAAKKE